MNLFSKNDSKRAIWLEYDGDKNNNRVPDVDEIGINYLKGDGDFRSKECIDMLKTADIICTNPPFSLFREYVSQLMEYKKKFIIVGHQNAITYKEIFKLIYKNEIWLGYGFKGGAAHFITNYKDKATAGDHKEGMVRVSGVNWFTNLDINKCHQDLPLYKKYTPEEFPFFDDYKNCINVAKTADIPLPETYNEKMGVPITFLTKYNPNQFEILGIDRYIEDNPHIGKRFKINRKETYARIIIRHKQIKS